MSRASPNLQKVRKNKALGNTAKAIRILDRMIRAQPNRRDLHIQKVAYLDESGDLEGAEAALRDWQELADEVGAAEALTLLGRRPRAGRSVEARAHIRLAARQAESRRVALLSGPLSLADRVLLLALGRDSDGLSDILGPQASEVPVPILRTALDVLSAQGQTAAFVTAFGPQGEAMPRAQLLTHPALMGLERDGEHELGLRLVQRLGDDLNFTDRIRICVIDMTFEVEGPAAAATLLADWMEQDPDNPRPRRFWLRQIADGRMVPDLESDAAVIAAAARAFSQKADTPRDAAIAVSVLLEIDRAVEALDLAIWAQERFPESRQLQDHAYTAAMRISADEEARELRTLAALREEVDHAVLESVGPEAVQAIGGHVAIKEALHAASSSPADAEGLRTLARMFVATLAADLRLQNGRRREAEALHDLGAASWGTRSGRAERAAGIARVLCLLALRIEPQDREAAMIYVRLHKQIGGDARTDRATAALCRFLLSDLDSLSRPDKVDLWSAALSIEDENLWNLCGRNMGLLDRRGAEPLILRLMGDEAGSDQVDPNVSYTKRIEVHGPLASDGSSSRQVDLGFPSFVDEIFDEPGLHLHGALVVKPAGGEGVLRYSHSRGMGPRNAAVGHAGARALAIVPAAREVHFGCRVVVVPGGRAHFSNYFHFTGQMLPRCLYWMERDVPGARLAVPADIPEFARALLEVVGLGEERLLRVPVDALTVLDDAAMTTPTALDWQAAPAQVAALRHALAWRGPRAPGPGRRLFLVRSHGSTRHRGRVVTNEEELIDLARARGFEAVDPGGLSIDAQRELFAGAEAICGATGAALTNIVFLPKAARAICLSPHETCRTYFPGLTLGGDVDFTWVLGTFDSNYASSSRFPHLPYHVPPERLRAALDALG